jgi:hypothetical protein
MDEDGVVQLQGSYKDVEWINLPCHSCNLIHESSTLLDSDASNHFRSKVSIDSLSGGEGTDFAEAETTSWGDERDDWTKSDLIEKLDPVELVKFFADWTRFFMKMDYKTMRVVVNWLGGKPLRMAADEINQSVQGTHRVLKAAHEAFPALKAVKSIVRGV